MLALALTDAGNLYGAIEFYKECKDAGIKPILGVDAYTSARTRFDKQSGIDSKRNRIVLLAKNTEGYRNLIRLVTASYMEGFYYKPRVDQEILERFRDQLIAIIPSFSGDVSTAIRMGDKEKADKLLAFYKKTFGDDLYIEITHHPEIDGHELYMKDLIAYARERKCSPHCRA
jgi:DNA polymerase III subunit alpha